MVKADSFLCKHPQEDQTKVEIWYQMNAYVIEMNPSLEGGLMDFYQILSKETKDKGMELYPDFIVGRSQDLMVQGRTFYAIWDEEKGLWSRDEYDVQRLVDEHLEAEADRLRRETGMNYIVKYMRSFQSQLLGAIQKIPGKHQ